jgi:glucose/arabinose dehydrogenase
MSLRSLWSTAVLSSLVVGCTDASEPTIDEVVEKKAIPSLPPPPPPGSGPVMFDKHLAVRTVVDGLVQPTSMAFLGHHDLLVLQKNSGQVWRVKHGVRLPDPVLDLAVNSVGGRGLMGIAVHPEFPAKPYVYLYWTESTTGADSNVATETPLLGSHIDRFVWNGSTLSFDKNLIDVRAADGVRPSPGLYGGVIAFGPDGKLYIMVGDVNRRGHLQNLDCGPPLPERPAGDCSDPIGGESGSNPVAERLTGVILRLEDDGSTPTDNPFYCVASEHDGELIQKIFAYGIRNSFGMTFDPVSGELWATDNADDTFDEINRVTPGMNSGWIQFFGPVDRIGEFKAMESTFGSSPTIFGDTRWLPSHIADSSAEALDRLYMLPGAHYADPEFTWKWAVPPAAIGFAGKGLGRRYAGDLFVGGAVSAVYGGHLFHFKVTGGKHDRQLHFHDPRLHDRVADNVAKNDLTESETLLIGGNFGTLSDLETSPEGTLYAVSFSRGAIYEIHAKKPVKPMWIHDHHHSR